MLFQIRRYLRSILIYMHLIRLSFYFNRVRYRRRRAQRYNVHLTDDSQRLVESRPPRYSKIVRLNLRKCLQARLKIPRRTLYSANAHSFCFRSCFSHGAPAENSGAHNCGIHVSSPLPCVYRKWD